MWLDACAEREREKERERERERESYIDSVCVLCTLALLALLQKVPTEVVASSAMLGTPTRIALRALYIAYAPIACRSYMFPHL